MSQNQNEMRTVHCKLELAVICRCGQEIRFWYPQEIAECTCNQRYLVEVNVVNVSPS